MPEQPFIVRTKRFVTNPLLHRKQFVVDIVHPGRATPTRKEVQAKLASAYKVADSNCVVLFHFKTGFGGGRTTGFGLIYDNINAVNKFEPEHRRVRAGLCTKPQSGRRGRKELKNKAKKKRGLEKAKLLRK